MDTDRNHWKEKKCAKAFWNQHELPPYKKLLRHTADWLDPQAQERWLDLGCGCGQLSRVLWNNSHGLIDAVVGVDFAAVNEEAYQKLRDELGIGTDRLRFVPASFLTGLAQFPNASFNGVVSGLAIHYAESYSESEGRWTAEGYDRVLAEVHRILRPGGRFVFSVMVPEPKWSRVFLSSLAGLFRSVHPLRYVRNGWRMNRYGGWLTREARRHRFHYLPLEEIAAKLNALGFVNLKNRLSYAKQAYLIRCEKP
jgi:SAM-dependent methyltransferase